MKDDINSQAIEISNNISEIQLEFNKTLIKHAAETRTIDSKLIVIGVGGNMLLQMLKTWVDFKLIQSKPLI